MPQQICNFFFLGTQHHRDNTKGRFNVIHQYFKNTETGKFSHKRLFDGPGGMADSKAGRRLNPMPGLYNMDFDTGKKKNIHSNSRKTVQKFLRKCQFISGSIFGDGVENNILEAVQYLEVLNSKNQLPDKINLYGFSRGGDTSIILSNVLWKLYPEIEVNICVVDPVPGVATVRRHESKLIPPNVRNMTAILMQDETAPGFTPTDQEHIIVASPTTTKINYQIYRGHHGTGTIKQQDGSVDSARLLTHDTFYKFAQANGTRLINNRPPPYGHKAKLSKSAETKLPHLTGLTQKERLIQYQKMKDNAQHFKCKNILLRERHLTRRIKKGDYHSDPDFFINQEHRELFALSFPAVFDYFFKNNAHKYTIAQLSKEIKAMHDNSGYPLSLYHSIEKKGCRYDPKTKKIISLSSPSGSAVPEKLPITNSLPVVYDEASYLQHSVKSIINQFEILHDSIHIYKNISDKLYFSNKLLSISKDFRKALDEFNSSTEPEIKKTRILKLVVLKKYEALRKIKKLDILDLHQFSLLQQMGSLIETELREKQLNDVFEQLINPSAKRFFSIPFFKTHRPRAIPAKDLEQLHTLKSRLKLIMGNTLMPERDKIISINMIMEDTKNYIEEAIQGGNAYLALGWAKRLKRFSQKMQKIISGYTTYADRAANKFNLLEKKYSIFASAFEIISFTKIGKKMYNKHKNTAHELMLIKDKCMNLKHAGDGNNKDEISKILDITMSKKFIRETTCSDSDIQAVSKKLKEEIVVLRGTTAHFKNWKRL